VGLGKLTHSVAKARLSSAFLAEFLQIAFTLQVSEVHTRRVPIAAIQDYIQRLLDEEAA
jgi:hypothetical protein